MFHPVRETHVDQLDKIYHELYTEDMVSAVNEQRLRDIPVRLITHSSEIYLKELKSLAE